MKIRNPQPDGLIVSFDLDEVFVTGGGTIYKKLWDKADRLYLTVVHQECEGDTVIPSVDPEVWREVAREVGRADEKNECDYTFINYERVI